MSSTPKFAHCDTKKPDGFYVQFERKIIQDSDADRPDEMQDGFWPSSNPNDAGYIGKDGNLEEAYALAKARMDDFEHGVWEYVGIRAIAKCLVVCHGVGTYVNLESAGLWGVESDSHEDYLTECYDTECGELKALIEAMQSPIYE